MYFKRLELCGFKSFADKTVLDFEPGVTAVVGPNGCGKSNIFDSIRWVLGEQSVKELRGSKMEDVIFNGTDTKPGQGMAEVSLTFDNMTRVLAADYDEITVTRRVFRSGESEYLLNKSEVRLKDIQSLLMGTGIGAESYSLIQQGKIDLILSSRPEDRRLIFDEASGITKYKAQKREALRKLEETEQNLLRLNDIIVEVNRQISSLERQANKARRFKEVFEQLKDLEIKFTSRQLKYLNVRYEESGSELSCVEDEASAKALEISELTLRINEHSQNIRDFDDKIAYLKDAVVSLENVIGRNQNMINVNQERIAEFHSRILDIEGEKEVLNKKVSGDKARLDNFGEELDKKKEEIENKKTLRLEADKLLEEINSQVKKLQQAVDEAKEGILKFASRQVAVKNDITSLHAKLHNAAARKKRIELDLAKVAQEKSGIEESLAVVTGEVSAALDKFNEIQLRINSLKESLRAEKDAVVKIEEGISSSEKEQLSLESQKEFLEKLQLKYEDISEAYNTVMLFDKLPDRDIGGFIAKVTKLLKLSGESGEEFFKVECEAKPIPSTGRISARIGEIASGIETLSASRRDKLAVIESLERDISARDEEHHSFEVILIDKKAQQSSVNEQLEKINSENELLDFEYQDINQELDLLQAKEQELNLQLTGVDSELARHDGVIKSCQEAMVDLGFKRESVLLKLTQLNTELESLNKAVESETETLQVLENAYAHDKEDLDNRDKEIEEIRQREKDLLLQIHDLQRDCEAKELDKQNNINLAEELKGEFETLHKSLDDGRQKLEDLRVRVDELNSRKHKLQMLNQEIAFKRQTLVTRIQEVYKIDINSLEVDSGDDFDENAAAAQIETLRKRADSYGSVNVSAIEEYDELKQRYDFLTQQQSDLMSAKQSLHDAILKINRTTKKMFLDTFNSVAVEFKNYFRLLFQGGDAQISLVDESDPLESGIDIVCRPPGKKLQNVLLLSGGEKSLSAIALMFAVIKVKPTPFCVLDEIDAALDELNVDRFSRLLHEFAKISQFIVITHNKKTIANANVMYGITMAESGVSKIVSVKFSEHELEGKKKTGVVIRDRVDLNTGNVLEFSPDTVEADSRTVYASSEADAEPDKDLPKPEAASGS